MELIVLIHGNQCTFPLNYSSNFSIIVAQNNEDIGFGAVARRVRKEAH